MKQNEWFPNVREITAALVEGFEGSNLGNKRNPFNELIYIILSAKTPPQRYQRAFRDLKRRYPRFNDLADTNEQDISDTIRYAGLEEKKAAQILGAAKRLKQLFGRVTLSPLRTMSNGDAEQLLITLPGIGIKSARCILMYSLDRKVFPADNHCLRISKRIGWIPVVNFSRKTSDYLQSGIPPDLRYSLHVGMVRLGREYCFPRDPSCHNCPILTFCPTGKGRVHESCFQ